MFGSRNSPVLHETEGDLKDMPAWKMPETCCTSQKFHPDAFAGGRGPKIHVRKGLRQNIMRPRFPISTFPLKLSRSQEQASRIKPSRSSCSIHGKSFSCSLKWKIY